MSDDDNKDGTSYEDKAVVDGTDTLAQGHGEPPADEAGITGGADADADANPAFHGGGMDAQPNGGEPVPAFQEETDGK